ncbi:MAG TPA: hypothetical protein VJN18_05930 [Polyangiaceae bacterium]|nr:hypothetical protein [Polyangiaceae bacterium]
MNHPPFLAFSRKARRLLWTTLLSLPLAGACSDDEETAAPPVDLTLTITALDGSEPDAAEPLRCDGTLAVQVAIEPARSFTLRPLHACGDSTRCGYVHVKALDSNGESLASVESVTTLGLLELPTDRLSELARIEAVLLRGIDAEPVLNADRSEVSTSIEVSRPVPQDCEPIVGAGGAGGAPAQGGAPPQGGAENVAGSPSGGAPPAQGGNGAGGAPSAGAGGSDVTDPGAGTSGV